MVELPVVNYVCEAGCAACCRHLIIEIHEVDIAREPKLAAVADPFRLPPGEVYDGEDEDTGENLGELVPGFGGGAMLACGATKPCPMIDTSGLCSIYPTRPTTCVGFRAGSAQCQNARKASGMMPLKPE